MAETDETGAVRRAQAGDVEAFQQLFDAHHRRIHTYVLYMVGVAEDADDITQATFIKAWGSVRRLRAPEAFAAWLHRIAANLVRDYTRRRRETPLAEMDAPSARNYIVGGDAPPEPDEVVAGWQAQAAVREAVQSLPEIHRAVVVMHHLEGMEVAEIAQVLGVPHGTVLSRLARARCTLRRKLSTLVEAPPEA